MYSNLDDDLQKLIYQSHDDPHSILGIHPLNDDEKILRFWHPHKEEFVFYHEGRTKLAKKVHESGLFTYNVCHSTTHLDYQVLDYRQKLTHDPYTFNSYIDKQDELLMGQGVHYGIHEILGSKCRVHLGICGVGFCVWAPNARSVSVVGDFNEWNECIHIMRRLNSGIFEIFIPGLEEGSNYKYCIKDRKNNVHLKIDPYAHQFEMRPKQASIIASPDKFCFRDQEWIEYRSKNHPLKLAMNIYEVHLGSWLKRGDKILGYKELASELVTYCKDMGFTHVELLPVTEHPLDESWGYEVTGFFAPTSRHGTIQDFQYFVNHLHMHFIGVIIDWVPGHFPKDDHALALFDGDCCFENSDELMREHPEWGTMIFDYSKPQVCNFLIASALFWIEKMHVDGIRVDAVQSMLYLDYARKEGEFKTNAEGGRENLDAIEFIKHLNSIIHKKHPWILVFAEDASFFPKVTDPVEWQGLGFDLKWNLGWMHDMLEFFALDPVKRKHSHHKLVDIYNRAFDERYILCLSHDEVVHEKGSIYQKMTSVGDNQFAHLRLFYSMAICHPGKNLFFMGVEIAQKKEWCEKGSVDWGLLKDHRHIDFKRFVRRLNHFYLKNSALFERDIDRSGFVWIDHSDYNHSIISFLRKSNSQTLMIVHNFTPTSFTCYDIYLANVSKIQEVFNTDEFNTQNGTINIESNYVTISISPLSTMIFEVEFENNEL